MTDHTTPAPTIDLAPEPPPKGVVLWLRENLFSSFWSGLLSVVVIVFALEVYQVLLNFFFDPRRRWEAITHNLKLLMVQSYPSEQLTRVWLSVAIVMTLLAATLAFYRVGGRMSRKQIGAVVMGLGSMIALGGVLGYVAIDFGASLPFVTIDVGGGVFGFSAAMWWVIVGALMFGVGYLLRSAQGEAARQQNIPTLTVIGGLLVLVVLALFTIRVPKPVVVAGQLEGVFEPLAMSTRIPWTLIIAWGVVVYIVSWWARERIPEQIGRRVLVALWVLSYPIIILVVLRDPDVDMSRVLSWYLPMGIGFAVVGTLILNLLASPRAGERGRLLGALLVVGSLASFLFPMEYVVRLLLITLAMFGLAAATFGGEGEAKRRFLGAWIGTVITVVYLAIVITSPSTVEVPTTFFIGGLGLTFVLAITGIAVSFPLGVLLALGRTSSMPIFRMMSTVYIEIVRGVPLITWLLVAFILLPVALPEGVEVGGVMRAIGAITFFSAAYLAENVRGGLQSIPNGQYEASRALGMTTTQMTVFIVLPQALRAVIPALVGQVIALFKDTSLVIIVGLFDFLFIARNAIPGQSQPFNFLGTLQEGLVFAAVIYWIFTFTFSRFSQRLEKKLGVGER